MNLEKKQEQRSERSSSASPFALCRQSQRRKDTGLDSEEHECPAVLAFVAMLLARCDTLRVRQGMHFFSFNSTNTTFIKTMGAGRSSNDDTINCGQRHCTVVMWSKPFALQPVAGWPMKTTHYHFVVFNPSCCFHPPYYPSFFVPLSMTPTDSGVKLTIPPSRLQQVRFPSYNSTRITSEAQDQLRSQRSDFARGRRKS